MLLIKTVKSSEYFLKFHCFKCIIIRWFSYSKSLFYLHFFLSMNGSADYSKHFKTSVLEIQNPIFVGNNSFHSQLFEIPNSPLSLVIVVAGGGNLAP